LRTTSLRVATLAAFASAFAGCSGLCNHLYPCPTSPVEVSQCLHEQPPQRAPVSLAGPEAGCPASFVGCLGVDDALKLEHNEREALRWEREAWQRCGPLPDAGAPDAR